MNAKFTPEFVDQYLFGRGLVLANYFIHRTPISEVICFLDEKGEEFTLSIGNDELARLMMSRLKELNVREVVLGGKSQSR